MASLLDPAEQLVMAPRPDEPEAHRAELLRQLHSEGLDLILSAAPLDAVFAKLTGAAEALIDGARLVVVVRDGATVWVEPGPSVAAGQIRAEIVELLAGSPASRWPVPLRRALLDHRDDRGRVDDTIADVDLRRAFYQQGVAAVLAMPIPNVVDRPDITGALLFLLETDRTLSTHETHVAAAAAQLCAVALQQHLADRELANLAHRDRVTGLPNRAALQTMLDDAIRHARAHRSSVAVMVLDLDNFKIVNDSIGHAAGDQVLSGFAERVGKLLRPGDVLGRFGGDEFVVLLKNVSSAQDAQPVAERLLDDLRRPFRVGAHTFFLSVSVGIASSDQGRDTSEALLRNADAAMYQAKARGRSRVEVYDLGLPERAAARVQLEGDLHRALDAGQFVLHWQPKVALDTGRIVSAEALLRWQHPERGLIPPIDFIAVTEELELINRIGEWALGEAIAQRTQWEAQHGDEAPWSIAVNVSSLQLAAPKVVEMVERSLGKWNWPADRLVLELTESVLMDESPDALNLLDRLQHLGVKLAIDDFGTGYSSLSYLHRFPVDQVKLDRAFVTDITASGDGSPIARAVIDMAHALGITVTAEGVETRDQLRGLRQLRCDRVQGFWIARPMPADQFSALLATRPRYDIARYDS